MEEAVGEAMQQHLLQFLLTAPFAAVALFFVGRGGMFQVPESRGATGSPIPSWFHLVFGLAIYLVVQVVVATVGFFILNHFAMSTPGSPPLSKAWVSVWSVICAGVGLVAYVLVTQGGVLRSLWMKGDISYQFRAFCAGAATWLLAFPIVIVLAHFLGLAIIVLTNSIPEEQVAVDFYRNTQSQPALLLTSSLLIGVIVPVVEEVLFRLLFQSAARRVLAAWPAIVITSLIFSLFHYAGQQGVANVQLLLTLFCLSLFLGVLYERWGTLWAPIGLHAAFNTMSMVMMSLSLG